MKIKSSRSLGDVCRQVPITDLFKTFSIEEALMRLKGFKTATAYYIETERDGARLFGLEGNSHMFRVPEQVYQDIGSPASGKTVKVSGILSHYRTRLYQS